ncbi:MAG: hypothetical protein RLZZ624_675 [Cyanobacteriota bacterium]|jgi:hypothetical protein
MPRRLVALLLPIGLVVAAGRPVAAEDLNSSLEQICQPLQELAQSIGASVAPGTRAAEAMRKELAISRDQYRTLWALLKVTPTRACRALN